MVGSTFRAMSYESIFPQLSEDGFSIESPVDYYYNCIAWAAGKQDHWWWPRIIGGYWPSSVPEDDKIGTFVRLFENLGYNICDSAVHEAEFEKVAIYARNGRVLHAARQLESGRWTSKLGFANDIEHSLSGLEGQEYGQVAQILKRRRLQEGAHPQFY